MSDSQRYFAKLRLPFHKSLFITVSALFLVFVVAVFLFQYNREKMYRQQMLNATLQDYNTLIYKELIKTGLPGFDIDSFIPSITEKNLRITVLDLQGNVLTDSEKNDDTLYPPHRDRPEIVSAIRTGSGYSLRPSKMFSENYFYAARKYDPYIVRTALPFDMTTVSLLKVDRQFIYFLILTSIIIIFSLLYFCNRLGKSISLLKEFSNKAEQEEPIDTRIEWVNNDIGAITENIIRIYRNLLHTKKELSIEKEKLIKHLQFSKQGLAVYSEKKQIILANNLFIQYVNLIADRQPESMGHIFELPEFKRITTFIDRNLPHYPSCEEYQTDSFILSKGGKSFQVECIIFQDRTFEISIHNITRQEEENRLKRQLTQNIAHELKTPVSSIQGYMETITGNPDMPEEKRAVFLERCYAQTTRLSGLLHDISMLNRIDESEDLFDREPLDLARMIREVATDSQPALQTKNMTIRLDLPESMPVTGNPSLLYSIFRNLTDNAIAYAGEKTLVQIHCYHQDPSYYYFAFADNGTGVAEEHLNRLFERFYRIDKGRSRKLGGTGLGLAIVKNAVLFHKGEISAKNRPGGGLEFLFTLCKD